LYFPCIQMKKKAAYKYLFGAYLHTDSPYPEYKGWFRGDDEHEARAKFNQHLHRKGAGDGFYFLCVINCVAN